MRSRLVLSCLLFAGCGLQLDPPPPVIHARFDPDAKVIPMPTDVLRDAAAGHLHVPIDDTLTDAEKDLYTWLDTMDGWSSASQAKVELTGKIDPATVDDSSLEVWQWRETPERVDGATVRVSDDGTEVTIDAPRTGWQRGGQYFVVMRGGDAGVQGRLGEKVECDAAFYFLRQTERLDTPEHVMAFPGDTNAEREANAAKLEAIREDLSPIFDFLETQGLPRDQVAALWKFTVTTKVELAMDEASQRMPLPIDLLIDPPTGKIDLPPAPWDSPTVVDAKAKLAAYDGFGTSMRLTFGFTDRVDPATITDQNVELWKLAPGAAPEKEPISVALLDDGVNVEITPADKPLSEQTTFAVVVKDGVRDADGNPIALMPAGKLMQIGAALTDASGKSRVGVLDDAHAAKVEQVRAPTRAFLDQTGDTGVLAAWTYTTMSVAQPMQQWIDMPATTNADVVPHDVQAKTPGQALADFPLAIASLFNVKTVYTGTIQSPVFLDDQTRGFRGDGGYSMQGIKFTMTVPNNLQPGQPVPVMIFGHAIMTESRFVLAIGDALAAKGIAAISIDLPMHGTRTYCWADGPLSIPNPTTGQLTPLGNPCSNGASCSDDGKCVDQQGQEQPLTQWPVLNFPMASGAAFIEIEHISNTRDHFIQAEIDLSALLRSLREGDWSPELGGPVDTSRIYYGGQSLGGIIGGTFVSVHPEISTSVLNVPGADSVDLFSDSPFFGGQVTAFFHREGVDPASYDGHRFLNVARWFMDSADPQSFATRLTENGRAVLIQMATLDAIIPNKYTEVLQQLSGAPRRDYIAEHAFLVIPIEPEYLRGGSEMANFLSGWRP